MKSHATLRPRVTSFENLHTAFRRARAGKRDRPDEERTMCLGLAFRRAAKPLAERVALPASMPVTRRSSRAWAAAMGAKSGGRVAAILLCWVWVAMGCASIGAVTEGRSGPIAWRVADLRIEDEKKGGQSTEWYRFSLFVTNTSSATITIRSIERIVGAPGEGAGRGSEAVTLRLEPNKEVQRKYGSSRTCRTASGCTGMGAPFAPIWQFVLNGTDDNGRAVSYTVDVRLPADLPAASVAKESPRDAGADRDAKRSPAAVQPKAPVVQAGAAGWLDEAWFTNEPPQPGVFLLGDGSNRPPQIQVFDAEKDTWVALIYWIKAAHRKYELETKWYAPSGTLFDKFDRSVDLTRGLEYSRFYTVNLIPLDRIREYPGQWTVEIFVDGQSAGKHSFELRSTSVAGRGRESKQAPGEVKASDLVVRAMFTKEPPEPGGRVGSAGPAPAREFDAEKDRRVAFYYSIKSAYRKFELQTKWYDPSGALFDTFRRTLDLTRGTQYSSIFTVNVMPTERIKGYPGEWTVELIIDGQPAGRYGFRLASVGATSGPAPGPRADRPEHRVGDRWILSNGVLELIRIDGDVYVYRLGGDREYHRTRDGHLIKSIVRGETVISYDPPFPLLAWPLEVGKRWLYDGRRTNKIAGRDGATQLMTHVVAYEDVETPAGTFKAFKVTSAEITYWYSPEAKTIVKYVGGGALGTVDYALVALDREGKTAAGLPSQLRSPETRFLRPQDMRPYYGASWAVVVGIDRYGDPKVPPLRYAVADARAVADMLPGLGFAPERIVVLENTQASKAAVERALYGSLKSMGADGRLFVFFAGHGVTQAIKGGQEGYLLTVDADPANLPLTALAMRDLAQIGKRLPVKHILFVLDACFSGYAVTRDVAVQAAAPLDLLSLTREPVVQILTAGSHGQRVFEEGGHGVFTKHLLKGLEGWADLQGSGLTLVKLAAYIQERVARDSGGTQTPQYGKLDGEGEFLFRPPRTSRP